MNNPFEYHDTMPTAIYTSIIIMVGVMVFFSGMGYVKSSERYKLGLEVKAKIEFCQINGDECEIQARRKGDGHCNQNRPKAKKPGKDIVLPG